jgi:hypothetical protein
MRRVLAFALTLALTGLAPRVALALGTKVLIYSNGSSSTLGYGGLASEMMSAGATSVVNAWPTDLAANYRLVFLMDCAPLSASQLADLQALVAAGGGVVMAAEPIDGVGALNAAASGLGIGARLVAADVYDGCSSAPVVAQVPLTDQVPAISLSRSTTVSGGMVLFGGSGADVVTVEGTVLLAGDTNMFSDSGCLGCCAESPETIHFWHNVYNLLPMDKSMSMGGADMAMATGGDDAGAPPPPATSSGGCAMSGRGARPIAALAILLVAVAAATLRRKRASPRAR